MFVSKLELDCEQRSKWFDDNILKINAENCYFLIMGTKQEMHQSK